MSVSLIAWATGILPSGLWTPTCTEKATLNEASIHIARHYGIVVGQEAGIIDLIITKTPWAHRSDYCKVDHSVTLSGSSNEAQ